MLNANIYKYALEGECIMRKKIILPLIVCALAVAATLNITHSQAESTAAASQTKTAANPSNDNQKQNSAIDSSISKGKNPPCPSAGCGKDLSDLKSGTYTITSAGLSRKYIIDIPADYDKNKPYRVIFGMHMMGGNMSTVMNMKYYGLKTAYSGDVVQLFHSKLSTRSGDVVHPIGAKRRWLLIS